MSDYPYAPSLELYREWQREANHNEPIFLQVAAMAARWGADRELEACLTEVSFLGSRSLADKVRTSRRPKITEDK